MSSTSALLATRIAGVVPRLLSLQVEPAEEDTADAVDEAVERLGDALLGWHDDLIEGRTTHRLLTPHRTDASVSAVGSQRLRRAVARGRIPGNPVSTQTAALELDQVRRIVADVLEQVDAEDLRETGTALVHALQELADALETHASVIRDEHGQLARLRRTPGSPAPSDPPARGTPDQILARVVRAEQALMRCAMATLRA